MELGRSAREAALAQAKLALEGFGIKQGMIKEGKLLQDERVTQVAGNILLHRVGDKLENGRRHFLV